MKNLFRNILSLFTQHEYSRPVEQDFYRWLVDSEHAKEKDEALQGLWEEAQKKGEYPGLEESLERWKRNNGIAPMPKEEGRSIKISLRLWQTVAAVLLIATASLGYLLLKTTETQADLVQQFVPIAQMKTLHLPDGSRVQVNSGSALLYPKQFTGKNRSVYLIGEANFNVKPDKKHPFIVKTEDFQVTALGTEFNVSAYAEEKDVCATLLSGSVLVEYDNLTKRTVLQPEEQLVYDKENRCHTVIRPDMEVVTAWQKGELVFRQMTLAEIITVLERKYDYQFIYSLHSLRKDRYSFRFKENAPLSDVMDVIVDVAGDLSFNIQGDKCYIKQE